MNTRQRKLAFWEQPTKYKMILNKQIPEYRL